MLKVGKRIQAVLLMAIMMVMMTGCSQTQGQDQGEVTIQQQPEAEVELLISAAASLQPTLETIATEYNKVAPNIKLVYSFGGSGALQSQIEEGAPADIFISAAQKQMNGLAEKQLIVDESRQDLLLNEVVLIVPKDSQLAIENFEQLSDEKVKKVGLGEPKAVPVGQYSEEILQKLGILDVVTKKAVYGSDVRQVLTWVESGEVDCGVVYATDAASSDGVTVVTAAPKDSHKPVIYPIAVIKDSKHQEEAQAFMDYLASPDGMTIFEGAGFKAADTK